MTVLAARKVSSKLDYVYISNTLILISVLTLIPLTHGINLEHDHFTFSHRVSASRNLARTSARICTYRVNSTSIIPAHP